MNDLNSSGSQNSDQDAELWSKLKQVRIIAQKKIKVWTDLEVVLEKYV